MYVLLLTLMVNTGSYAGYSGMTTITLPSKALCKQVGDDWLREIKDKNKCKTNPSFYQCIKL